MNINHEIENVNCTNTYLTKYYISEDVTDHE